MKFQKGLFTFYIMILILNYLVFPPGAAVSQGQPLKTPPQSGNQSAKSVVTSLTGTLQETQAKWSLTLGKVFWAIVAFLFGFLAIKYITRLVEALAEHWTNFRLVIKRLIPIIRIGS